MRINILFTCAGRKVSLIESFRRAMKQLQVDGTIIGTDVSPLSAALNVCDCGYIVPSASDQAYIPTLLSICREREVRLLMPLIDVDLLVLATHKSAFSEIGVLALVSSFDIIRTCRDKRATAHFFSRHEIPTVRTINSRDIENNLVQYPVFIKPSEGSGSAQSFEVCNADDLAFFLAYVPDPIVQEFARGQEYTIDTLSDLESNVINVVPRKRIEVRAGEISKGVTVKNWQIIEATADLLQKLDVIGPATVQGFYDGKQLRFTEINPRLGGGVPLTIAAGADYPLQIIRMALGESIEPRIGHFVDGLYMFRYEEAVYVHEEVVNGITQRRVVRS